MHELVALPVISKGRKLTESGILPTIFRNIADNSLITNGKLGAMDFDTSNFSEEHKMTELPYANGQQDQWSFDGIRLMYSKWNYNDYIQTDMNAEPGIVHLHFNLRGKMTMEHTGFVKQFVMNSQQHNIFYANGFDAVVKNHELQSESFIIQLSKDTFGQLVHETNGPAKRFLLSMKEDEPVSISNQNLYIDILMQNAIKDILKTSYQGRLKELYLYSKCLEIIVLQLDAFERAENSKPVYCKTEYDQERILFAREYLIQNMEIPPGLKELSRIAGINEFKLKKGFKEMFNNTVFGYLSDYRLELAKSELIEGKKSATEIAFELGYSSLQHFSSSYKKKFGVSPKGKLIS